MIEMVRIDERLVHGQVALIWTKELGVNRILVVNDAAANDPILSATLKMAAPESVKAIVLAREQAKVLMADPRFSGLSVLVVVNSPADALFVSECVDGIKKVNIGNYGKADKSSERERMNDNVFLDDADRSALKAMIDAGLTVEYQLVPSQQRIDMREAL